MRPPLALLSLAAVIAMAACSKRDPVEDSANGAMLPEPANYTAADPVGAPPANEARAQEPVAPAAGDVIPAAMHGRWGLTPADCTSARGDAKGLLVISGGDLRFYESRAVPGADVQTDVDSVNGTFDFTGEGQTWSKYEALKVRGNKLTRTETNPAASFTYAKC